jgi:hypothetical protein
MMGDGETDDRKMGDRKMKVEGKYLPHSGCWLALELAD